MNEEKAEKIIAIELVRNGYINFIIEEYEKQTLLNEYEDEIERVRDEKGRPEIFVQKIKSASKGHEKSRLSSNSGLYLEEIVKKAEETGSNYIFLKTDNNYIYGTPYRLINDDIMEKLEKVSYPSSNKFFEALEELGWDTEDSRFRTINLYKNDIEAFKDEVLELNEFSINNDLAKITINKDSYYCTPSVLTEDSVSLKLHLNEISSLLDFKINNLYGWDLFKLSYNAPDNKETPIDNFQYLREIARRNPDLKIEFPKGTYYIKDRSLYKDENFKNKVENLGVRDVNLENDNVELIKKGYIDSETLDFLLNLPEKYQNMEANKLIIKYCPNFVDYKKILLDAYKNDKKLFKEYFTILYKKEKRKVVKRINKLYQHERDSELDRMIFDDGFGIQLPLMELYSNGDVEAFKKCFRRYDNKGMIIKKILDIKDEKKKNKEIDRWVCDICPDLIPAIGRKSINYKGGRK